MATSRAKVGAGPRQSHSLRVLDEVWAKARRRAAADGTTVNAAAEELLEGYGQGLIDLPKVVKTFSKTRQQAS